MGLDLSAKRKPKSKAKPKPVAEETVVEEPRSPKKSLFKGKPKSEPKKSKKSKAKQTDDLDAGDAEIVASNSGHDDGEGPSPSKPKVKEVAKISAFCGGFVHPALEGAVNTHWRRTAESDLLLAAMEESLVVDGFFVGSIYVKSSFAQKTGGGMLL